MLIFADGAFFWSVGVGAYKQGKNTCAITWRSKRGGSLFSGEYGTSCQLFVLLTAWNQARLATQQAWFSATYHLHLIKIPSHLSLGNVYSTRPEQFSGALRETNGNLSKFYWNTQYYIIFVNYVSNFSIIRRQSGHIYNALRPVRDWDQLNFTVYHDF